MSITMSSRGREQQINRFPTAGGSSGSGSYITDPEINPHSQVWQTPVRQDQRTGTSQASASSSRLWNLGSQETVRPARANETLGPPPGNPSGACGCRRGDSFMPGVMGLPEARPDDAPGARSLLCTLHVILATFRRQSSAGIRAPDRTLPATGP